MISIIIPTRNRPAYLKLLLQDVLNQDVVEAFEVIVVDQSDTPQPVEGCTYISLQSKGPCISRNTGVRNAEGDILVFLDDDARINSNFIREITGPIRAGAYPAVSGAICDPEGNYLSQKEAYLTKGSDNFIKVLLSNPNYNESRITLAVPGGCMAILKSVYDTVGGFEERFDPTGAGEDREFSIKLYKHGYAIWYNANAKLLHAVNAAGGSRDVGSRTLMLDVHSYWMCKEHFSEQLASTLRTAILNRYKKGFYAALGEFRLVRTKYSLWQEAKKLMN
tara:strand:+ start:8054 stop:8887 length:834 start_codon:yes stop_codon:yes gene_type:complete